MNSLILTDFYKTSHKFMYPEGTEVVYSNLTARKSRRPGIDSVVFFGLQYFIKEYLIKHFNENFFLRKKEDVVNEYIRVMENTVGGLPDYKHIEELHDLGNLPIKILALEEGTSCPIGIPMLIIYNTDDRFYWITNYLESLLSCILWGPITSATTAKQYKKIFTTALNEAGCPLDFVKFMGHDFSFRGMFGLEAAIISGMGHLTSFSGTDSIPSIIAMEEYYGCNMETELIGCSVPASEHSIISSGTAIHGEFETFKELMCERFPKGILSIVSDTFDLWKVLTDYMPRLKNEIMKRDGKIVIRPDSGDPVDIICGLNTGEFRGQFIDEDSFYEFFKDTRSPYRKEEFKGVVELLWDTFGGTVNEKGYKILDPHVGAIYGDSITTERAEQISERLMSKGFGPLIIFGIGSFSYTGNTTRDTFGMAIKCTAIKHNDKIVEVFKDPVTDDGTKKSAKGLLLVNEHMKLEQGVSFEDMNSSRNMLQPVFENGKLLKECTLQEIRTRIDKSIQTELRYKALDEMTALDQEMGLYDQSNK